MPKVLMSDIKSGSEKVKSVFRKPMTARTIQWLNKQTFANYELLEILYLSNRIENHKDKRSFYQRLITSQKGPFNLEVFTAFSDELFNVDALLNLLNHTKNLPEASKLRWLDYIMVTSTHWAVYNFFSKGSGISYGIDVTKPPFNKKYIEYIIRYADKVGNGNINSSYFAEVNRILDSMNEEEIYDWYLAAIATTYEKRAVTFLMAYDKMPEIVLTHYWNKSSITSKYLLATHPNIPYELREWMYKETQDEKYLPPAVKDLFLF